MTVYDPQGNPIATAIVDANGNWSATPTTPLVDGLNNLTITATDPAGNEGPTAPLAITIDTAPPAAPLADVAAASDTGVSNSDNITKDNTPTISGTGVAGDTITVTFPGGEVQTVVVPVGGNWSVTPTNSLPDGVQNVTVTATDPAGNTSAPTTVPVTIDTTVPSAPLADVAATSDTGISNTDNITSDNTPTISGGSANPGDTITVTMPGTNEVLTTVVAADGTWSVTPTQALADSTANVTVTATDPAGNISAPTTVPVTIDSNAPAAPTVNPLTTNDSTPVLTGTATLAAGETLQVAINGATYNVTVGVGGNWSLDTGTATPVSGTLGAFVTGTNYPVTATVTDLAGNATSDTTTNEVLFDNTAPSTPTVDALATNNSTPVITGTANLLAGETLQVTVNGATYNVTVASNGTWSLDTGTANPVSGSLGLFVDGTRYPVTATITDSANNQTSDITSNELLFDTTAPSVPAGDVAAASDTGASNTDNITSDTTPEIIGTGTPGDTIRLYAADGITLLGTALVDAAGNWSITPTNPLPEGSNALQLTATDPAGNTSAPGTVNVTIDTSAPVAPTAVLDPSSDTGVLGDSITHDNTPTLSGTGVAGDTITIKDPNGNVIATAVVDVNGNWNATPVNSLPQGVNNLSVTATDPAGNISAPAVLPITIDTTASAAPVAALAAASDSGIAGDSITNNNTPTITGTGVVGDTINLYAPDGTTLLGSAVVAADGTWSITPIVAQPDGLNNFKVNATDAAGNVSAFTTVPVTIDTAAPNAPAADVAALSDTGSSNTDNITSDNTPTISGGSATPGDTITVTMPGTNEVLTTVVAADGTWSVTPTHALADGTASVSVTATDPQGNVSTATLVAVTIDTTAPNPPVAALDATSNSGLTSDNITNDNTPLLSGTGVAGDTITVMDVNGNVLGTAVVAGNGSWSFQTTVVQPNGLVEFSIIATDPAGNTSLPAMLPVVIDTVVAAPVISPTNGVGQITGTGEAGATVTLTDTTTNAVIGTAIVAADGTWSITPSSTLPNGDALSATQIDVAGNVSQPATSTVDNNVPNINATNGILITGTGKPGDYIALTLTDGTPIRDANGAPLVVLVDSNGNWTATSGTALADGTVVKATDTTNHLSDTQVVDALAPTTPIADVAASSDSGISNTDNITSDTTPTIVGNGTAGDVIKLYAPDGTTLLGSAVVAADGTWAITPVNPLPQGLNNLQVTATDPLGNTSAPGTVPVTIDTSVPTAPVADVAVASDTGVSNTDNITNDNTPTITGTGNVGDTITVTMPGTGEVLTAVVDANGNWSVTPTQTLADGTANVSVTATDPAGNVSPTTLVPVTIDTTAPAAPVADVAVASDTGVSNSDNITSDNTPTISGTGTAGDIITVTMPITGEVLTAVVAPNGTWSVTPTQALADGTANVSVTATDTAGNVSPATLVPVTIDTTAPTAPVADVAATSDSGVSNTDNITSDNTPTISGTGTAGDTITVTMPGTNEVLTAVVAPNGTWSVTPTQALADGTANVSVIATDPAGNVSPATLVPLTIDTTPPAAPVVTPISTSDTTPTITGTATLAAGESLQVTVNGATYSVTVANNGTWSLDTGSATPVSGALGAFVNGQSYSVTATTTDAAGNATSDVSSSELTIDTTPPAAPVVTPVSTADLTPTITGTATLAAGESLQVTVNGATYNVAVGSNGSWALDTGTATPVSGTLGVFVDGQSYSVTATTTDLAGNTTSDTSTGELTIDTSLPASPVGDVAATSDSGISNTDNITSDNTPEIVGTGTPGNTIKLYAADGTTLLGTALVDQNGNWSITPATSLLDGLNNLVITATDPQNRVSAPAIVPVTIDTSAPAAPAADVAVLSDTGVSNTDNITSDTTPTISGTGTAGDTITVTMPGTGEILTTVVAANGTWSVTPSQTLADGTANVSVTATDPAGNVSPATLVAVTIDTTAPAAPPADVATASDTGVSNTDNITNDTTPTISGTGTVGDTITVTMPGTGKILTTVVAANGTWSVTPTQTLADGTANVSVTATDPAGNVSPATLVAVTIDTTAPAAPPADVAAASDNGVSNTDNLTNDTTPTISGTGTVGDTITVTMPGTNEVLTTVVASDGTWSVTPTQTLADGTANVSVTATDPAGNVSPATLVAVTIDTTVPAAPAADVAALSDTGVSNTDNITSDNTPTISGTGTAGDTITVTMPGTGEILTTVVAANGTWSVTPSQTLADGTANVSVTATDPAGNVSPATLVALTIDTTAPLAPVADVAAASDTGVSNTDNITSDTTPTISGTGTVGDTITVTMPGTGEVLTTVVAANGTWSVTPTQTLADGTANVSVTATDPAGNISAPTNVPVTIDTTIGAITVAIPEAVNSVISSEAADGVQMSITVPADAKVGDVITTLVTAPDGSTSSLAYTLLAADLPPAQGGTATGSGPFAITQTVPQTTLQGGGSSYLDGAWTTSSTLTDAAGNTSAAVADGFTLAANTPVITIATIAGDNIINAAEKAGAVAVSGTTTHVEVGQTVTVNMMSGSNVLHTYTAIVQAGGTYTLNIPSADMPADGSYSLTADVTNALGIAATQATQALDVDATAPIISVTSIASDAVSVSQNGTFDAIERGPLNSSTVATPLVISGSTDAETGQTVTFTLNGQTYTTSVQNGGTWAYTLSDADAIALKHGSTYAITAMVSDLAGNSAADSDNSLVVNIAPPDTPTVVEKFTGSLTPTITGSAKKEDANNPGSFIDLVGPDTLSVTVNNVTYTLTVGGTSSPAGLTYSAGTWSLAIPAGNITSTGDYEVAVSVTAGGVTKTDITSTELHITNAAPTITLNTISDGSLNAAESSQTLPITGTTDAPVGATVTVIINSVSYTALVQADGSFTVNVPGTAVAAIADGTQTVSASVTNQYGLTGNNSTTLIVDKTAPAAPVGDVAAASDTGISNTDNVTRLVRPDIVGTAEPNAVVKLYAADGTTLLGTVTADGSGNWSITPSADLKEGLNNLVVTATDAAGNISPPATVPVTVDTIAPAAPTVNPLTTADTTPLLTGTATLAAGETLTVTVNGATYNVTVASSGTWSLDTGVATPVSGSLGTLTNGSYAVTATVTDLAGNSTSDATTNELVINTNLPILTGTLAISSDSGILGDSITNDTTPTITGQGTPGQTIKLYAPNGTTVLGTTVVLSDGTWSITPTTALAAGLQNLSITSTNSSNVVLGPVVVPVTIDTAATITVVSVAGDGVTTTAAPTAPLNGTFSIGERGFDTSTYTLNSTVTTPPVISGTTDADVGSTVTLTLNSKTYTTTVVAGTAGVNTWSYTLSDADAKLLNHGNSYAITATVVDAAANTGTDTNNGVVINIAPPDVPTVLNQFNLTTLIPNISGVANKIDNLNNTIHLQTGDALTVVLKDSASATLASYTLIVGANNVTTGTGGTGVNLNSELSYDKTTGIWTLGGGNGIPATIFTHAGVYNVDVTTTVPNGAGTLSRSDVSSSEITILPTAPIIDATAWSTANTTSDLTGVQEALYDRNLATFNTAAGVVDNRLYYSEVSSPVVSLGTVVRVQLPNGTGSVPVGANDIVKITWGDSGTTTDVVLTAANITAKYVDVTVPFSVIDTQSFGDVVVSAQLLVANTTLTAKTADLTPYYVFDLPLANTGSTNPTTGDNFGFRINGRAGDMLGYPAGETIGAQYSFGSGMTMIGDVNGDGYDDMVTTATQGTSADKSVFVVFGQSGNVNVDISAIAAGNSSLGFQVKGATNPITIVAGHGDYNNDGLDDITISMGTGANTGGALNNFVVFGKTSGTAVQLSSLTTTINSSGFMLNIAGGGTTVSNWTGTNMNMLGDLNGDGYEDIGLYETQAGTNYNYQIVYGSGTATTVTTTARNTAGPTSNGYIISGGGAYGNGAVGADINGDGYNDVIARPNGLSSIDVYFGSAQGITALPTTTGMASGTGYRITGVPYDQIGTGNGYHVYANSDINGDGLIDMVTSVNGLGSYVFFGKTDSTSFNATTLQSGTSSNGFFISGVDGQISSVGDFNGDGLGDILIGDNTMSLNGQTNSGGAYLIYGKTSSAVIQLTNLQVSEGFRIDGASLQGQAGRSVSGAGDINGDGFDDLLIAEPYTASGAGGAVAGSGINYVVYGGPSKINSLVFQASNGDVIGTSASETITGTTGSNQLIGGQGDDTIIGAGGADVMNGGIGDDVFVLTADNITTLARNTGNATQDIARIDGGTDIDTITFTDGTLDLSQISNAAIEDVERFDMTSGTGVLKMNLLEVLNLSKLDNAFNTTNGWTATSTGGATGWGAVNKGSQVVVDGTSANHLYLADNWTNLGTVTNNGLTYKVLQSDTALAQVLVDNRVLLHLAPQVVVPGTELANTLNIAEANSNGTDVKVNLIDTGAAVGNTIVLVWGSGSTAQTISYTLTAADISNGYANVNVSTQQLLVETALGITESVPVTVSLIDGSYTVTSAPTPVIVDFTVPTAPTISATAWAATAPGNTSSMTGIQEAYYDRNSTTFSTAVGTVDNRLYYSEASSPSGSTGTVLRVQLPTTGTVPTVAGDIVIVTWGNQTFTSAALTTTDITNKYLDMTVPYSTIDAQDWGSVTVTAQIQSGLTGNVSATTSLMPYYVFDLPLANTGGVAGDNFGYQINGRPSDNIGAKSSGFTPATVMVGDVNGDGYDDMVIGAGQINASNPNAAAFVVFGSSAPQNVDLSAIAAGGSTQGFMVAGLTTTIATSLNIDHGDFNGDGLDDISFAGITAGKFIVYGRANNTATVQASSLGATANSNGLSINAGVGFNNLGDLNGNGVQDWGTSVPTLVTWRSFYVEYGVADATTLTANSAANTDFTLTSGDYLYNDFATYADVNGDGYSDLVLRATSSQDSTFPTRAEIYFGSATGLSSTNKYWITGLAGFQGFLIGTGDINGDGQADMTMATGGANVYVNFGKSTTANYSVAELASGTSTNGFLIQGVTTATPAVFGQAKVVGDFNGDGLDDFVIGQTTMTLNGAATGGGYLIYGKTSSSTIYLTDLQVSEGFRIDGVLGGDKALTAVSGGGDVNGDGFADLIVSAPNAISSSAGGAGQASGATAGGVDYIIYGGPSILNPMVFQASNGDLIGTGASETLTGTSGNNQIVGGQGDDTLVGSGGVDVLYGGAGNDVFVLNADNVRALAVRIGVDAQNIARVDGGGGLDTLRFGEALVLSLQSARTRLENLERFDLNATGGTLQIETGLDVNAVSDYNRFSTANGWTVTGTVTGFDGSTNYYQVVVDGSSADFVRLGADFVQETGSLTYVGSATTAGAYDVYTSATTRSQVLVKQGVQVLPVLLPAATITLPEADLLSSFGFLSLAEAQDTGNANATTNMAGTPVLVSLVGTGAAVGDQVRVNWENQPAVLYTLTVDDLNAGYARVSVPTSVLLAATAAGTQETVGITAQVFNAVGVPLTAVGVSGAEVDFTVTPGTPPLNAPIISTLGTDTVSAMGGITEATGGTIYRTSALDGVALKVVLKTAAAAGDWLKFTWGNQEYTYHFTAAVAINTPATITIPYAVLEAQGYGTFNVSVQQFKADGVSGTAIGAASTVTGVKYAFDMLPNEANYGFVVQGEANNNFAGYSVSNAGDVNGDGFDDLIVGAPGNSASKGRSYVVFGGSNMVSPLQLSALTVVGNTQGFVINGAAASEYSGFTVTGGGDINGDGLADLVVANAANYAVGAGWYPMEYATGGGTTSATYVVFGKTSTTAVNLTALTAATNLTDTSSTLGFKINTTGTTSAGWSVSNAGDVNGDGLDDVLVANPTYSARDGRAYLIYGKASGASVEVSSLPTIGANNSNGFMITADTNIGTSATPALASMSSGDINGDGYSDLVMGVWYQGSTTSGADSGGAYVLYGQATNNSIDISALTASANNRGFRIIGEGYAGMDIAGVADVNGDGLDDVLLQANQGLVGSGNTTLKGAAWVVYGKTNFDPVNVSAIEAGVGGFAIGVGLDTTNYGAYAVSSAGDFNGDGLGDIIVTHPSASYVNNGATTLNTGAAYIVFGKTGTGTVQVTSLDGSEGFRIVNPYANEYMGSAVSGAGDLNGDGFDDVIIGNFKGDTTLTDNGKVYVVYGGVSNTQSTVFQAINGDRIGTAAADTLTGTTGANQLVGGLGNDTLIGGGGADVLYGGMGNDVIVVNADNVAKLSLSGDSQAVERIDGGGGIDTFKLDGAGITLDLSMVKAESLRDMEKIDLTGSGNNTLKLNVHDMLENFTSANVWNAGNSTTGNLGATVSRNQLMITGDAGDKVVLSDLTSWAQTLPANFITINGHAYDGYNLGAAQLLIEHGITVSQS